MASYTVGGVYSLLKRLKCGPKVPRPVHAKADLELQAAWKKGAAARAGGSDSKSGNGLGFSDPDESGRVGLRGMVRRVWGSRGVKVYQRLQLAYHWRSLFLVVNAQAGKLHWCWLDSMAGEQMVAAVGGLQKHTEVATVVWDGAPGHRDGWVRELGMPLIGLPPYSPELNPAERVFEEVRREIEGEVYATLDEKVTAVQKFLTDLESDPERVCSLTWWDWIETAVQGLPSILRRD